VRADARKRVRVHARDPRRTRVDHATEPRNPAERIGWGVGRGGEGRVAALRALRNPLVRITPALAPQPRDGAASDCVASPLPAASCVSIYLSLGFSRSVTRSGRDNIRRSRRGNSAYRRGYRLHFVITHGNDLSFRTSAAERPRVVEYIHP